MSESIVVGTDGSQTATQAVLAAIELARAFDKPLHIVSAYRPQTGHVSGSPEHAATVSERDRVESILSDVGSRARQSGVKVETHARAGDPADELLKAAEEFAAHTLVVGNRGIGSVKRFVLGNVPSKVVHNAPCSTYVVHTTV